MVLDSYEEKGIGLVIHIISKLNIVLAFCFYSGRNLNLVIKMSLSYIAEGNRYFYLCQSYQMSVQALLCGGWKEARYGRIRSKVRKQRVSEAGFWVLARISKIFSWLKK